MPPRAASESGLPKRGLLTCAPRSGKSWELHLPFIMKKFVFGCLFLLLLCAIGAGVASYYFIYRPARSYMANVAQLRVIPELNEQILNKAPYAPPATGELEAAMVDRFLATQQTVQAGLGARLDALGAKYQSLQKLSGETGETPSVSEFFEALKDLSGLIVEAKRAQVAALNERHYSLEEYEWTRRQIYQAAGIPIDGTLEQIIRDASAGKPPDFKRVIEGEPVEVPEKNKELVAPHAKELIERSALAFFGL